jgi:hypothetical protein
LGAGRNEANGLTAAGFAAESMAERDRYAQEPRAVPAGAAPNVAEHLSGGHFVNSDRWNE